MNIIFFGTPNFSKIILESLINNGSFNVAAIVTQPDKPVGRKQILMPSPAKLLAALNDIEVLQPVKLKDPQFVNHLKRIKADVFVIASYGKIIPKEVLEIPKYGCINVHGSILPKYRGASPIQYALLNGDNETGITIMLMDEGIDTGKILLQEKIAINLEDNLPSLIEKMACLGAKMLDEVLPKLIRGEIVPKKQDDTQATFTKIFKNEDCKIDWNKSAEKIKNQVRAMYPDAYGMVKINNKEIRMKILETKKQRNKETSAFANMLHHGVDTRKKEASAGKEEIKKLRNKEIGGLFGDGDNLFCNCGESVLELIKIQPEGKKVMSGKDFLNGHPLTPDPSPIASP